MRASVAKVSGVVADSTAAGDDHVGLAALHKIVAFD